MARRLAGLHRQVVGTLAIAADPSSGEDTCISGDADDFVLVGALAPAG